MWGGSIWQSGEGWKFKKIIIWGELIFLQFKLNLSIPYPSCFNIIPTTKQTLKLKMIATFRPQHISLFHFDLMFQENRWYFFTYLHLNIFILFRLDTKFIIFVKFIVLNYEYIKCGELFFILSSNKNLN